MNSNRISLFVGLMITGLILVYPVIAYALSYTQQTISEPMAKSEVGMLLNTLVWSVSVGIVATSIGWPIGVRVSKLRPLLKGSASVILLLSLAIPAYVVFYAWWQIWPAGTPIHNFLVEHHFVQLATHMTLFLALVGWSWPIPALLALMSNQSLSGMHTIQRFDGSSLKDRFVTQLSVNRRNITTSCILVFVLTATNTTCFDLAQIHTLGNEMRAVLAIGGSILDLPILAFSSLGFALFAALILYQCKSIETHNKTQQNKSILPILFVWIVLTSGPIILSAWISLQAEGLQLLRYYMGDLMTSCSITIWVIVVNSCLCLVSICLHSIHSQKAQVLVMFFDVIWLTFAFLPSSLIVEMFSVAWIKVDWVYQSQTILVLSQTAKFGFLGVLAGKWVVSGNRIRSLIYMDTANSVCNLFLGLKPRLYVALSTVVGLTLALSLSEVALTAQLSPPSTNQPIAVALLNAMHYQRPQIVTSFLAIILLVVCFGGLLMFVVRRKVMPFFLLACLLACQPETPQDSVSSKIIGGAGIVDGLFVTPRAIDATETHIVVLDKTGRLQVLDQDGLFQYAWELPLNGMGYPTGVSIDEEGLIWVPDTHGHRIIVFDQSGTLLQSFGKYGTAAGEFLYPTDVAFGQDGMIFVSEYGGNDRISRFTRDGDYIDSFGSFGNDKLGFKRPQSIAIHPSSGHLFIADSGNHRIVECTKEGEFVNQFGNGGRNVGEFLYPYSIEFLSPQMLVIAEYGNNRLQLMSDTGEAIGTFGYAGNEIGTFKTPWAAVKMGDEVVVADTGNNRLQVLPDIMSKR